MIILSVWEKWLESMKNNRSGVYINLSMQGRTKEKERKTYEEKNCYHFHYDIGIINEFM